MDKLVTKPGFDFVSKKSQKFKGEKTQPIRIGSNNSYWHLVGRRDDDAFILNSLK